MSKKTKTRMYHVPRLWRGTSESAEQVCTSKVEEEKEQNTITGFVFVNTLKKTECWKVEDAKYVSNLKCSFLIPPTVFFTQKVQVKIELLLEAYPNTEWLGYLTGIITEMSNYRVEDLVIPPHKEAYTCTCEAEPMNVPDNCVGVIHSHHSMGAFHSGTDDANVDRNFPISITVAKKNNSIEYDIQALVTTKCGHTVFIKGGVQILRHVLFDETDFIKQAKENIDKGKSAPVQAISYAYGADYDEMYGYGYNWTKQEVENIRKVAAEESKKQNEELDNRPVTIADYPQILNSSEGVISYTDKDGNPLTREEYDALIDSIAAKLKRRNQRKVE